MTASSITCARICRRRSARAGSGSWRLSSARSSSRCGARTTAREPGNACLEFFRERRRVGAYYFYILDQEFGPAFIKICTYAPYSAKVWVNGHEWAKRQAASARYAALSNGFQSTSAPKRLQAVRDSFGPHHVQAFFDRWITQIPTPLSREDRAAGYWAGAFDAPSRPFRTRIFSAGTDVRIDFRYKHSRVKLYLQDGRARRIDAGINKPSDLGVLARIQHHPVLIDKARQVDQRRLMTEQAGQLCHRHCAL